MQAECIEYAKIKQQKYKNNTKKMVNQEKTFKESLTEIQNFLSDKKQLSALAKNCNVSLRTVYNTFDAVDFSKLKGKQITVYRAAIALVTEIKSLPQQADNSLK